MGVKEDGTIVAKDVSEDHKPDNPAEKARIQAAGGRVFAVNGLWVFEYPLGMNSL